MELKTFYAQDLMGRAIPYAAVYVYEPGTTRLAMGLKDKHNNDLTNPFTTDATGLVQFAAQNGEYDIHFSSESHVNTLKVQFFDTNEAVIGKGSLGEIQALDAHRLRTGQAARITRTARAGDFTWVAEDCSNQVAADPGHVLYIPPQSAPDGAAGCWVRQTDGKSVNLRWAGAVGDGVTDDGVAFQHAWHASVLLGKVPIDVPPPEREYLVTQALDISSAHFIHLRGECSQRARSGYNAAPEYQNTTIHWKPADPTQWLLDDYATSDPVSFAGPYVLENLTVKVGGNGVRFGHIDADGDGAEDVFEDGAGQRYVFGAYIRGCQFHSMQDVERRHAANGAITRSEQVLVAYAKAFESGIEDTSFFGGGTQIAMYGCDRPVIDKVRGGGCQVGIWLRGSGSFAVDHLIRGYQIEAYALAAIINEGCVLGASDLRIEAQSREYDEPMTLAETARVAEGNGTIECSGDMSRKLFPGISVVRLTHSVTGERYDAYVIGVNGSSVTLYHSESFAWTPFSDTAARITRIHGYALLTLSPFDTSVTAGSFNPVDNAPVFVYVAARGSMLITGAKRQKGRENTGGSIVIGNRAGSQYYLNARMAFVSCTPNICASPTHPLVTVADIAMRHDSPVYDGQVRSAFGSQADLVTELTRPLWIHTPKNSATAYENSNHIPFVQVERDSTAGTTVWAWKKSADQRLVLRDETFPTTPGTMLRLRMLCRSIHAEGTLAYYVAGNGGSSMTRRTIDDRWALIEDVMMAPREWQGEHSVSRHLAFADVAGSDVYIAGVSIEELGPSDGGFVAGTWEAPMRFGQRCVWFDDIGNMRAKHGAPANQTDGSIIGATPVV